MAILWELNFFIIFLKVEILGSFLFLDNCEWCKVEGVYGDFVSLISPWTGGLNNKRMELKFLLCDRWIEGSWFKILFSSLNFVLSQKKSWNFQKFTENSIIFPHKICSSYSHWKLPINSPTNPLKVALLSPIFIPLTNFNPLTRNFILNIVVIFFYFAQRIWTNQIKA